MYNFELNFLRFKAKEYLIFVFYYQISFHYIIQYLKNLFFIYKSKNKQKIKYKSFFFYKFLYFLPLKSNKQKKKKYLKPYQHHFLKVKNKKNKINNKKTKFKNIYK